MNLCVERVSLRGGSRSWVVARLLLDGGAAGVAAAVDGPGVGSIATGAGSG